MKIFFIENRPNLTANASVKHAMKGIASNAVIQPGEVPTVRTKGVKDAGVERSGSVTRRCLTAGENRPVRARKFLFLFVFSALCWTM